MLLFTLLNALLLARLLGPLQARRFPEVDQSSLDILVEIDDAETFLLSPMHSHSVPSVFCKSLPFDPAEQLSDDSKYMICFFLTTIASGDVRQSNGELTLPSSALPTPTVAVPSFPAPTPIQIEESWSISSGNAYSTKRAFKQLLRNALSTLFRCSAEEKDRHRSVTGRHAGYCITERRGLPNKDASPICIQADAAQRAAKEILFYRSVGIQAKTRCVRSGYRPKLIRAHGPVSIASAQTIQVKAMVEVVEIGEKTAMAMEDEAGKAVDMRVDSGIVMCPREMGKTSATISDPTYEIPLRASSPSIPPEINAAHFAPKILPERLYFEANIIRSPDVANPLLCLEEFVETIDHVGRPLASARRCIGLYYQVTQLGYGGFGIVDLYRLYKGGDDMPREVAVKWMASIADCYGQNVADNELRIARALGGSPWMAHCLSGGIADGVRFMVMEYYRNGTLKDVESMLVSALPRGSIYVYLAEIIVGVHSLHQLGVAHRDLKPANIFVGADNHVRIGDFGLAHVFPAATVQMLANPACAPEVWRGDVYSYGVDFYAIGVMAHLFLTGGELPFVLTEAEADFTRRMLHPDPKHRLDYGEILNHEMFRGLNWDAIALDIPPPINGDWGLKMREARHSTR
ncbi:kinase-like domain-containing protein [Cyathus striatus]|nr:kinase-like domain-containing protein [Cyathus striatus]